MHGLLRQGAVREHGEARVHGLTVLTLARLGLCASASVGLGPDPGSEGVMTEGCALDSRLLSTALALSVQVLVAGRLVSMRCACTLTA
jgi:hypothetical protein